MNWRRGLFRLWIVGTALFVIAVALITYPDIKAQFNAVALQGYINARGDEYVVPQLCGTARGTAGVDYSTKKGQDPGPWDRYTKPNYFDNCWYLMSRFRPLYPEFKDVSDDNLSRKLYADHGEPIRELPNPWTTLSIAAGVALGVPLVILLLGASLVWAFSGFARTRV